MSILRTSVHAPALALAVALLASSSGVRADGADDTRPATDLIDVLRATPIARPSIVGWTMVPNRIVNVVV